MAGQKDIPQEGEVNKGAYDEGKRIVEEEKANGQGGYIPPVARPLDNENNSKDGSDFAEKYKETLNRREGR